jgi:hypothetical protein
MRQKLTRLEESLKMKSKQLNERICQVNYFFEI